MPTVAGAGPLQASGGEATGGRAAQAEQTRQRIIETAQRLFITHGFQNTSLQSIADEMGLTKAAVYYHFHTKNQILRAGLEPAVSTLTVLLDEAAGMRSRRQRLNHFSAGWVDFLVRNRALAAMRMSDSELRANSAYDLDSENRRRRVLKVLFGEDPTPDERLAYVMFFGMLDGLLELSDVPDEQLRETLERTARRILNVRA